MAFYEFHGAASNCQPWLAIMQWCSDLYTEQDIPSNHLSGQSTTAPTSRGALASDQHRLRKIINCDVPQSANFTSTAAGRIPKCSTLQYNVSACIRSSSNYPLNRTENDEMITFDWIYLTFFSICMYIYHHISPSLFLSCFSDGKFELLNSRNNGLFNDSATCNLVVNMIYNVNAIFI